MIAPFLLFQNLFHSFGTLNGIISKKNLLEKELSSLFWAKFVFALSLNIILVLSSNLIVNLYGEAELQNIIFFYAVSSTFYACSQISLGLLHKNQRFTEIANIDLVSFFCSNALAIFLAIFGYGLYALVIRDLTMAIITFSLSFYISRWNLRRAASFSDLVYFFKFGSNITVNGIITFFSRNIDDLLIGIKHGSTALGIYTKSYSLLTMPHSLISNLVVRFSLPIMSKYDKTELVVNQYKILAKLAFTINIPMSLVLFFTSSDLVPLILGDKWEMAVPFIKIFSALSIIQVVGPLSNLIYEGRNKTNALLKHSLLINTGLLISIILGYSLTKSALGIAYYYTIGCFLLFFPSQYLLSQTCETPIRALITNLSQPFLALCFTVLFLYLFQTFNTLNSLILLSILKPILIIIVFSLTLYFIDKSFFQHLFKVRSYK